jgi:hypothetical protein
LSSSVYYREITTSLSSLVLGQLKCIFWIIYNVWFIFFNNFADKKNSVYLEFNLETHLGYFHSVERVVDVSLWSPIWIKERYEFENGN